MCVHQKPVLGDNIMLLTWAVNCSLYSFMKVVKSTFVMVLFLFVMSSDELLSELSSPVSALLAAWALASIKYVSVKVRLVQYNHIIVHAQYYIAIISCDIYCRLYYLATFAQKHRTSYHSETHQKSCLFLPSKTEDELIAMWMWNDLLRCVELSSYWQLLEAPPPSAIPRFLNFGGSLVFCQSEWKMFFMN